MFLLFLLTNIIFTQTLKETQFLMTHDSGTGYWNNHTDSLLENWAKTQAGGFSSQYLCGARAFDVRPSIKYSSELHFHHAEVEIYYPFKSALIDLMDVMNNELVVFNLWDCKDSEVVGGCDIMVNNTLAEFNIPIIHCNDNRSVSELSKYNKGLIVVLGCIESNYDKSVTCEPHCNTQSTQSWERLKSYINNTLNHHSDTTWMIQAHWQYDIAAIIEGILEGSSIIEDSVNSKINPWVQTQNWFHNVNFIELNDICGNKW